MIDLSLKTPARQAFEESLRKRVVGQDDAVTQVAEMYELVESNMVDEHKPLCTMMFLGPSGVGKSLLVKAVAGAIHDDEFAVTTINCAEFSEDHQIARIIGAPPGYIGHDTCEPVLCPLNLMRGWKEKGPRISIILFDEIEKASPKLHQLMLGLMATGEITDGKNRNIDLTRCMIFMTSNVGSRVINQEHIGFKSRDLVEEFSVISVEAMAAAKKKFDPEFLGRLTNTAVFRSLTKDELQKILDLELFQVYERALRIMIGRPEFGGVVRNIFTLALTDSMREFLLTQGPDKKYGARGLSKAVTKYVTKPLATIIATKQVTSPGIVILDVNDGVVTARFKEPTSDRRVLLAAVEHYDATGEEIPADVNPEILRELNDGKDYVRLDGEDYINMGGR